jgi:teichuronic acid exporter
MDLDSPETVAAKIPAESVSGSAAPHPRKMDQSLARSLAWKAAGDWVSQLLSWVSLLIIVRVLTPADFGIVAMAVIFFPFLRYVSEFGIPRTIVTLRDLTEDQIAQLNTVALLLAFASFGAAALLAKPIALFLKTPPLAAVVVVTCAALLPLGFRSVSEGIMNKEMQFRLLSIYDAVNSIAAASTTLALALLHFGYWALVLGNLVGVTVRTALIVRHRPHRFAMPRLSSIRDSLQFGWHVLVSLVALNSYQRLDNLTAGRVLGQTALGFYGMAWTLANVPIEKVTSLVTTVVPSYLAAVQKDPSALRRYLRTLTEGVALVTFPATVGLGLVARELIPVALGHKWDGVIWPLEVLSVYAAFRSIAALLPKVLTAVGNARYVMWNDLAALAILPCAFYIGSRWGTGGIAWGWVAGYPFVAVPLYWKTLKTIGMHVGEYFNALRPALNGTLVMIAGVELLKRALPSNRYLLLRLVIEIAVGAVAYTATLLVLHRERMMSFVRLARSFRSGQKNRQLAPDTVPS